MQDMVWKDRHVMRYVIVSIGVIIVAYVLFVLISNRGDIWMNARSLAIGVAVIVLAIYYVIAAILPVATAIGTAGIAVGNITDDKYDYNIFTFDRRHYFVRWEDVDSIDIREQNVWHFVMNVPRSFLIVTSKDAVHKTFVADPHGVVMAMKALGKANLLTRSSIAAYGKKDQR